MRQQRQTPSQTVGPFFGVGLTRASQPQSVMVNELTQGLRLRIEGTVFDGAGATVEDALIEVWQANAHGRYRHELDAGPAPLDPNFSGFGRCPTDANGAFHFETIMPGAIHAGDGRRHAPHLGVIVFARGMLVHAFTRVYFDDDALDGDPTLALVDRERRQTLIATRSGDDRGRAVYRWDIHLQGDRETVFFDA
jgi:protocatechuate 3,4-dioxygenase, alpha subunit